MRFESYLGSEVFQGLILVCESFSLITVYEVGCLNAGVQSGLCLL